MVTIVIPRKEFRQGKESPKDSVYFIIHNVGFYKATAQWIPLLLTEGQGNVFSFYAINRVIDKTDLLLLMNLINTNQISTRRK